MKNLDLIGEELFNKIRGRFPTVTIGNEEGVVTNVPNEARFFDFDFKEGDKNLGKVSVSIDDKSLNVMYSNNFVEGQDAFTKEKWYGFLKELRYFAKKRLLNFDTRDITKSNLNRRDYKFLANNTGDTTMSESKMYGTSKTSYQDVGTARLALRHSKAVNQELAHGRTQHVEAIYIESDQGERFKYPYRHLNGARAMARHVAEGGNAYDDFGKYIVSLSEELNKLRKFKNYMGRSGVMAEGLQGYMDVVYERIDTVKKTVEQLQRPAFYKEAFENYEAKVLEEVPEDVASNWIDQLTIRQFNEELKDVFPYIYKLVNEKTKASELGPEDLLGEGPIDWIKDKYADFKQGREDSMKNYKQDLHILKTVLSHGGMDDSTIRRIEDGCLNDPRVCLYNTIRKNGIPAGDMDMEVQRIGDDLNSGWTTRSGTTDEAVDDFDTFESWADEVVESGIVKEMHDDPQYKSWLKIYKKSPDAAEAHPKHAEFLKYYKSEKDDEHKEGNKFTKALKKARDNDDDEMEVDGEKIPVTEFVLSLFDRETGQFPKGETAVLTAVEKDYGEQYINGAKKFIEAIKAKYEEFTSDQDNIILDATLPFDISMTKDPEFRAWNRVYMNQGLEAAEKIPGHEKFLKIQQAWDAKSNMDAEIEKANEPKYMEILKKWINTAKSSAEFRDYIDAEFEKDDGFRKWLGSGSGSKTPQGRYAMDLYYRQDETLTPTDDEWSKLLQIPNRETWEKLIKQAKAKGDKKMLSKLMAMGDQFASTEGTVMEPTVGQEATKELEDMKRMAGISI